MKKDKNCHLFHCQNPSNCNLLRTVVDEIMSAPQIELPDHLNAHLGELEFIGFVSVYSNNAKIAHSLFIHSFALVKRKYDQSSEYTGTVCLLTCSRELIGSSINERALLILQLMQLFCHKSAQINRNTARGAPAPLAFDGHDSGPEGRPRPIPTRRCLRASSIGGDRSRRTIALSNVYDGIGYRSICEMR